MTKEKNKNANTESIFDNFTRKYQLSKTLRFELRPVGKTADFLKENKVFEKDKLVDDRYHEIKYYFDTLHREFIQEALQKVSISASDYKKYFEAVKQLKKAKKEDKEKEGKNIREIGDELRKILVKQFDETGKDWKKYFAAKGVEFKKDSLEILFEEAILDALKEKFSTPLSDDLKTPAITFTDPADGKKKNLFDSFKGFFTYFSNFNNTKRNLYSKEAQDTAVANRAINENLRKFTENIIQFNEQRENYLKIGLYAKEKEIFELAFYNQCFTQDGIDKYNRIIGGVVAETGEKIKGINEKINLYNQQHKDKKLRHFGKLFKQILSKKEKKQRLAEITSDDKVFEVLREFVALNDEKLKETQKLMKSFFGNNNQYDLERIYIKGGALNTISQKWFRNWSAIGNLLQSNAKKKNKKSAEENGEIIKLPDFVSIAQLKQALESRSAAGSEAMIAADDIFRKEYKSIYDESENHYETFLKIWEQEWNNLAGKDEKTNSEYKAAKQEVEEMTQKDKIYKKIDEQIKKIKIYCDAALAAFQMMKYFALEKGRKKIEPDNGVDNEFYNPFNDYYQDYPAPTYYNEFRNYLTKKAHLGRLFFPAFNGKLEQRHPFSKRKIDGAEKIKLNFTKGDLLTNWAKTRDTKGDLNFEGFGTFLLLEGKYHLAVSTERRLFNYHKNNKLLANENDDYISIFDLKQLSFKTLAGKGYKSRFRKKYSEENDTVAIKHLKEWIFERYQKIPGLIELTKNKYSDKKSFKDDIEKVLVSYYAIFPIKIKLSYFNQLRNNADLYLFEIYNKDFSEKSKGNPNLYTIYFKSLFDQDSDGSIKLDGGNGEIFFRSNLKNKDLKKERIITKSKKIIDKDNVYHNRRYIEVEERGRCGGRVFLHFPIRLNFGSETVTNRNKKFYAQKFNSKINELIADDKKEQKIKIIGVDRGENNLAYFSLIDQSGKLLKCGDLNGRLPNGETYLKKLEEKAGKREKGRKEWKTIENIKELKNGYISWVVRYLADMMINENAVLVFEDLGVGFKRGRQKIEQQVYQKLELALAQKLNYLVNKNAKEGEAGHYLKAHQLTPQIQTPQDIGKQCGVIFYVSPGYTSLTCPKCGYRKNISFNFENIKKARGFIEKTELNIAHKDGAFYVSYRAFDDKSQIKGTFEVSSKNVKRARWHKKGTDYAKENPNNRGEKIIKTYATGVVKEYDITSVFEQLFKESGIEFKSRALSASELSLPESADFYRRLFWALNLLLHSRNSVSGVDKNEIHIDYIQCPRCLFHSDNGFQGQTYNGDANGAYNIARKGLLVLRKIQNASDPAAVKWGDLKIDVNEWDDFVQR
jgi:hypothetical protein